MGKPHSPEAAGRSGHHAGTPGPQARQAGHPRSGVQLGSPQTKDEALPSSQALFPFCTHKSLPYDDAHTLLFRSLNSVRGVLLYKKGDLSAL